MLDGDEELFRNLDTTEEEVVEKAQRKLRPRNSSHPTGVDIVDVRTNQSRGGSSERLTREVV